MMGKTSNNKFKKKQAERKQRAGKELGKSR
jgi:hypothetical protein